MLKSRFFSLVAFFILINTDLLEANEGRGREGCTYRQVCGSFDGLVILLVLAGVFAFACIFCCLYRCAGKNQRQYRQERNNEIAKNLEPFMPHQEIYEQ